MSHNLQKNIMDADHETSNTFWPRLAVGVSQSEREGEGLMISKYREGLMPFGARISAEPTIPRTSTLRLFVGGNAPCSLRNPTGLFDLVAPIVIMTECLPRPPVVIPCSTPTSMNYSVHDIRSLQCSWERHISTDSICHKAMTQIKPPFCAER